MSYTTTIRSKRQRIVAALDVGTSKICCLIAKTSPAPDWFEGSGESVQFEVLGFDHTRAEGLKAGMITHLDSAEACIRSAVDSAERMAGVTVEDVHVTVTAAASRARASRQAWRCPPAPCARRTSCGSSPAADNMPAATSAPCCMRSPSSYRLDENGGISDPHGMCGERLAVDLHAVTADEVAMRNLMLCVERCHLSVASLIAAPYSSALSVVTPDEAKLGVAVHRFRRRHHHALGVRRRTFRPCRRHRSRRQRHHHRHRPRARSTSRSCRAAQDAARQRLRHAVRRARDHHLSRASAAWRSGSLNQITKAQLAMIIRPRIEEILDLMRRRLAASGSPRRSPSTSC